MGERHAARSRGKIPFVQGFDFVEVLLERLPHLAVPRSISTTRRLDRGSELA